MNRIPTKHILIVDDSADIQGLLRLLLESKGYSIECRSDGAEAIDLLNSTDVLPDVILLDLRMPRMDGFAFIAQLGRVERLREIPTVVMTGESDLDSVRMRTRGSQVLRKPLSMMSILSAVEKNVRRVKQTREGLELLEKA